MLIYGLDAVTLSDDLLLVVNAEANRICEGLNISTKAYIALHSRAVRRIIDAMRVAVAMERPNKERLTPLESELLAALHVARSRMAHFTCGESIQVDAAIGNAEGRANA